MSHAKSIGLIIFLAICLTACGSTANTTQPPNATITTATPASGGGVAKETPSATPANAACYEVKTGEKAVLKSQTFAIDFEPFKGSCFVTSHDPDFTDPPLESEIAIYKYGKKTFDFPNQFNGVSVGCWVNAVAFQDVNEDKLTDVVVVGECGTKGGSFHENVVYINDGKTFFTREDSNAKLGELKSIKDILKYIKDNPQAFSNASSSNRQS